MEQTSKSARAEGQGSMKRKREIGQTKPLGDHRTGQKAQKRQERKPRTAESDLSTPHDSIISVLAPKYDVLTASVISSTRIHNRIVRITEHLRQYASATGDDGQGQPRPLVLLHARPREACKLITVVEQCKRIMKKEGRACYQYNQLFELPPDNRKQEIVEATVLQDAGDGSAEDDDFEVMESRFEQAIQPPPSTRVTKSLRIFIAPMAVPELKLMSDVTLQADGGAQA